MDSAPIVDLRDCSPSGRLYGGRAGRKEGILIDGEPWICKYPRPGREFGGGHVPSYTSSPLSEYLGSHIYAQLGIPVHETMLGYRNGSSIFAKRTDSVFDRHSEDANALEEGTFSPNISCYLLMGEDGKPHHIKPFEYMAHTSNPDLARAVHRFAERVDFKHIVNLFESVPEEAFGWAITTPRRCEVQLRILKERLERGILLLA